MYIGDFTHSTADIGGDFEPKMCNISYTGCNIQKNNSHASGQWSAMTGHSDQVNMFIFVGIMFTVLTILV